MVKYGAHLGALNKWKLSDTTFKVDSFVKRLSWYVEILDVVKTRSGCHKQVGALLINSKNHIVSMGFNGSPPKMPHCKDRGCFKIERYEGGCIHSHCISTVHAEINTLANFEGSFNQELVMISTYEPCLSCVKTLMAFGIKKVFYLNEYIDKERDDLLNWYEKNSFIDDMLKLIPLFEGRKVFESIILS